MRFLYSGLLYLAVPFILIRLFWRARNLPDYRKRLGERFGYYPFKMNQCIWIHAVSVGETIAAIPLVKSLKHRYPTLLILMTTMTPTGARHVKTALGESVRHAYLPYDLPGAVKRFLQASNPILGIIMETELWPNLLLTCKQKTIPVCLMNARLSEHSAKGYKRIASLTKTMLQSMAVIAAHGEADALRFIQLGAEKEKVVATGNIKFDLDLPSDLMSQTTALRHLLGSPRFIWIAASTHEGEEEIIFEAHQKIRDKNPDALLILTPRHPERFDAVAKLSSNLFLTQRRSLKHALTKETAVYLADTMGELLLMYSVSDAAFVGGSLSPRGGHNMLEPGSLGKPILTGPYVFNFAEISELFLKANALIQVSHAQQLATEIIQLMEDKNKREAMGQSALHVMNANRGALGKQLALISTLMQTVLKRETDAIQQ